MVQVLAKDARRTTVAVVRAFRKIETERLVLRWKRRSDAAGYAATVDAEVVRVNGWTDANVEEGRAHIAARHVVHHSAMALMTARGSGDVLGVIWANRVDCGRMSCEIGWWTGPHARRAGYGSEAVVAVVAALHAAGIGRVWIGTAPENQAVQRIANRTGARLIGESPHRLPNGDTVASLWFAHDVDGWIDLRTTPLDHDHASSPMNG